MPETTGKITEGRAHPPTLTRRRVLQGGAAMLGAFALPLSAARPARAAASDPVLVSLYLRGAADGLNLVVPADDPAYYALRPGIAVKAGDEIALDGFYGLNPALGGLLPLYEAGDLAIVHAAGSTHGTRSHFDAQDFMERAAPGDHAIHDGWLNRYLGLLAEQRSWSGISLGSAEALALSGAAPSLAIGSIETFVLQGAPGRREVLATLYEGSDSPELRRAGGGAFEALDVVGAVDTATAITYPNAPPGQALADAAALIRADIGVRAINIDVGGWDHHEGEDQALGPLANALATALVSFQADLGADAARTCTLVMTEFGRTAAENGTLGTDHGHGGVMLAMGAGVAGGRVITRDGAWPGLGPGGLHEGRDLAVTTDFRDVFAEVLHRHLGVATADLGPILPGHDVQIARMPGLFG